MPTTTLWCWIHNYDITSIFSVEVQLSDFVYDLKESIKLKTKPVFDDIAAFRLDLWKACIPDEGFLEAANKIVETEEKLHNRARVSDIFTGEELEGSLNHIIVKRPVCEWLTSLTLIWY